MSIFPLLFVIAVLAAVVYYACTSPEVAICEYCLHMIQRSEIDEKQWFHIDLGMRACNPDDPCSDVASPHPQVFL